MAVSDLGCLGIRLLKCHHNANIFLTFNQTLDQDLPDSSGIKMHCFQNPQNMLHEHIKLVPGQVPLS